MPRATPLRRRRMTEHPLVGTWRVRSFELRRDGGDTRHPFGSDPRGYLIYTADGFMSWAVMRADRSRFAADDPLAGTAEEKVAAAETHIAYCGRYSVRGDRVTHHVEVASFPNYVGGDHVRFFDLHGGRLTISSPPIRAGGAEQTVVIVLERAVLGGAPPDRQAT